MTVTERAALLAVRFASLNGLPLGVKGSIAASRSSSLLPAISALDSHACGISTTFVADYVHHYPTTLLSITGAVKTSSIPGAGAAGGSTGSRAYAGGADDNHVSCQSCIANKPHWAPLTFYGHGIMVISSCICASRIFEVVYVHLGKCIIPIIQQGTLTSKVSVPVHHACMFIMHAVHNLWGRASAGCSVSALTGDQHADCS